MTADLISLVNEHKQNPSKEATVGETQPLPPETGFTRNTTDQESHNLADVYKDFNYHPWAVKLADRFLLRQGGLTDIDTAGMTAMFDTIIRSLPVHNPMLPIIFVNHLNRNIVEKSGSVCPSPDSLDLEWLAKVVADVTGYTLPEGWEEMVGIQPLTEVEEDQDAYWDDDDDYEDEAEEDQDAYWDDDDDDDDDYEDEDEADYTAGYRRGVSSARTFGREAVRPCSSKFNNNYLSGYDDGYHDTLNSNENS